MLRNKEKEGCKKGKYGNKGVPLIRRRLKPHQNRIGKIGEPDNATELELVLSRTQRLPKQRVITDPENLVEYCPAR